MPVEETNLAERSGNLVESNEGYDPRLVIFYPIVGFFLLLLLGGLAYQQLSRAGLHHESERQQNERRLVYPGPRGNIYDRNHKLLVGNRPRLAVVLYLDELRREYRAKLTNIRKAYKTTGELPTNDQMTEIAWNTVVQGYLDQVNNILGRDEKVDPKALQKHFTEEILLPYTLIDDLQPAEYAQLLERLPVSSPLRLYTTNTRYYPYKSAASHVLGYVGANDSTINEDFPGEDLTTFQMKGTVGREGLEKKFDDQLQGEPGYSIVRVDPSGYQVNEPLESARPRQGKNLVTSIDIDLQLAAEQALVDGEYTGSAVALDVATGEVLALASKPDYDLNTFSPRISKETYAAVEKAGGWINRATQGLYPPGSTFKILTSVAGMRLAGLSDTDFTTDCDGSMMIGNRRFSCDNGLGHHGTESLAGGIATSCDIFFWTWGLRTGPLLMANEARRFHLNKPSGIELPAETRGMTIPDPAWKKAHKPDEGPWSNGDTANMAIGQGFVLESPITMACFAASIARNEIYTLPTLLHQADRPPQHSEPIGLTSQQYGTLIEGMKGATEDGPLGRGTAYLLSTVPNLRIPGVKIAGKTGTATVTTKKGKTDIAWFICFAPADRPEIAMAVAIEGDEANFGGADNAAPVAAAVLKAYFDKKAHPNSPLKGLTASVP